MVITAATLFVLIAIAALVVDLGFSWMLRRQEQNAADTAAIAAARWLRDPASGEAQSPFPEAYEEACFYAKRNGFFDGDDASCSAARARGDLRVNSPPVSGPYSANPGKIQVTIRSTHPSFFARIFTQTDATVTTSAVASNEAGNSNSSSLIALKPTCDGGGSAGTVTGGGVINIFSDDPTVDGGYVHVNSPCGESTNDVCDGSGAKALDINGGATLIAPQVSTVGSCVPNGGGAHYCDEATMTQDCVDEDALPLGDPLVDLPEPNFADFPAGVCPDGTPENPDRSEPCRLGGNGSSGCTVTGSGPDRRWTCSLSPGIYYAGWFIGNRTTLQLSPGMYIMAGGGVSLESTEGLEAVAGSGSIEPRITIFSTDGPGCPAIPKQCQDNIDVAGTATFKAKATNTASCTAIIAASGPNTCPWRGVLLWQDGTVASPRGSREARRREQRRDFGHALCADV